VIDNLKSMIHKEAMSPMSPEGLPSLNNQLLQNLNEIEFDETMLTVPLDSDDLKKTLCHLYGLK